METQTERIVPTAVGDHVIVDRAKMAEVSEGGIILPVNRREHPPCYGLVVAVGPKVKEVPVGSVVLFNEQESNSITYGSEQFTMLTEECVYGFMSREHAEAAGLSLEPKVPAGRRLVP